MAVPLPSTSSASGCAIEGERWGPRGRGGRSAVPATACLVSWKAVGKRRRWHAGSTRRGWVSFSAVLGRRACSRRRPFPSIPPLPSPSSTAGCCEATSPYAHQPALLSQCLLLATGRYLLLTAVITDHDVPAGAHSAEVKGNLTNVAGWEAAGTPSVADELDQTAGRGRCGAGPAEAVLHELLVRRSPGCAPGPPPVM